MLETWILPLFFRPILFGFLCGLIHFFVASPTIYNQHENYSKLISFNLLFLVASLPLAYFMFLQTLDYVSVIGRVQTNSPLAIFTFVFCVLTSLMFFGILRLPNFSNLFYNRLPKYSSISFLFDLNLYWFILHAYLLSVYFDNTLQLQLPIFIGFLLALILSNIRNHLTVLHS